MSSYRIQGTTGDWEVVIGLEVHAQVVSKSKLFSGAAASFGAEPNTQVSLVDAAMPGMLPVPNAECIRQAVRTGLAINAQINRWSRFDRKNYFYADLPQGYQISQLYHPLVGEGHLDIEADEKAGIASDKRIGVERIHVEQDAGKLMHDQHPTRSYVDLNRSGVALMEIVSRPDMASPAEAGAYLRKLRAILRYVGSCDGNMEEGSMRADVNVSVRRAGEELGTRTETKNVNSVRFVMQAIEHEANRQVDVLEGGGTVVQETRLFNPVLVQLGDRVDIAQHFIAQLQTVVQGGGHGQVSQYTRQQVILVGKRHPAHQVGSVFPLGEIARGGRGGALSR